MRTRSAKVFQIIFSKKKPPPIDTLKKLITRLDYNKKAFAIVKETIHICNRGNLPLPIHETRANLL